VRLTVDDVRLELSPEDFPADGLRLLDLAERGLIGVESSCRSASCGTCLVRVIEGAQHLSPLRPRERDLLEALADAATHRLGCQARLLYDGPGHCELRAAT
jgi:ferredoxin